MSSLHITSQSLRQSPSRWLAPAYAAPPEMHMSDDDVSSYLLTSHELQLLTGRVKHRTQIDWLVTNDIPFLQDASGRPKVLRKFIESKLSGSDARGELSSTPNGQQQSVAIRPNFAALEVHTLRRRGRSHGP